MAQAYGRLLGVCAGLAAVLLLAMVAGITLDVVARNAARWSVRGIDELSEYALYLVTALTAPWLLRQGQHVRIDMLLVSLPKRLAWRIEFAGDVVGLAIALALAWFGVAALLDSLRAGALVMKSFVFPEWWTLVPLPVSLALVGVEFVFRLHRLATGPRAPRIEATAVA
ncbi:MAG: TRAP transporter small permease [Alphaproteobacteria bacterium]|nr:TRAP transporter small permease [Alphaproteobacteria bacterium]